MRALIVAVAALGLAALAFGVVRNRTPKSEIATRPVAFENVYNGAKTLRVYAKVDDGDEQAFTASCNPKTCTFQLPLTAGVHDVRVAIEQNGVRGRSERFRLDTAAAQ